MKILVYEHVSGGGYAGQLIPPNVLAEGFGMLRCVVEDFKASGHEVTVLLDERLSKLNPPLNAQYRVPVLFSEEPEKILTNLANVNDAIYIIAPETGQTLQSLVQFAEKTGKISLNSQSEAIKKASDKAVFYETMKKLGVTPKTVVLNMTDELDKCPQKIKKELGYPVIVKPSDCVGCGGISLVAEETQLAKAIEKISSESKTKQFIAQEIIRGEAASVSLLSDGKKAMALTLNKQNVLLAGPDAASSYLGGEVPFDNWRRQEAFQVAEKVVEAFPGLKGYVGVDFVLTEHKSYVVDVNPRLTTSYVGLRKVAKFNVAEALVDAAVNGKFPAKNEVRGYACFSKMNAHVPSIRVYQKTVKLGSVVSPPFPMSENANSTALLIGEADSLEEARKRLEEAKNNLLNIIS